MKRIHLLLAAATIALPVGALAHGGADSKPHSEVRKEQKEWGIAGDAKGARRTIVVTMADTMRFSPDAIEVRQGETIRFVVKNSG